MTQHLLLIGIGPVHEFIERARRTRDVWFGSWILSDLARTVAHSLSTAGCTLIFPHPDTLAAVSDPNDPSLPNPKIGHAAIANQILVRADNPTAVLQAAQGAFDVRLKQFMDATAAFGRLDPANARRARDQVADLFEFHWATVPFIDDTEYALQRRLLYRLFNARKHTRTFGAIPWEQTTTTTRRSNKSSLDGWREVVASGQKPGENLSGVDLLRRYTTPPGDQDGFPSTSHMAALPFAKHLLLTTQRRDGVQDAWNRYIAELQAVGYLITEYLPRHSRFRALSPFGVYDGSLLYESRLGEDLDRVQDASRITGARESLRRLLSAYAQGEPSPYYAILAADGDHMGTLIDAITTIKQHQDLSEAVAAFAQAAATLVETTYEGAVIYAGGDDVLALLPLHTVVECAHTLQTLFATHMQAFQHVAPKPTTLSVGIAIVHHLEALQDSLKLARKAEKEAKAKPQRNALAIILSKRNGGDTTIVGHWGESPFLESLIKTPSGGDTPLARCQEDSPFWERFIWLVQHHQGEHLPDGFIFELRELHQRFDIRVGRTQRETDDAWREMIRAEIKRLPQSIQGSAADTSHIGAWRSIVQLEVRRILQRKHTPRGTPVQADVIASLERMLNLPDFAERDARRTAMLSDEELIDDELHARKQLLKQLKQLIDLNIIARELAAMKRMVEGPPAERKAHAAPPVVD